jgi:hypothetical protein
MTTATNGAKSAASTVGRMAFSVEAAAALDPDPGNELAASTGRARALTIRTDTHCEYCGKRMSPGRHGRRRYCCNAHRTAAYKRRQRAARKSAAGVTDGKTS